MSEARTIEVFEVQRLDPLPEKAARADGKRPPLAWKATLAPAGGDGRAFQTLLKAWEKDAGGVKVGSVVRAERKEYGGRVSWMVLGDRAAKAAAARAETEERFAAMERRMDMLEQTVEKQGAFIRELLRERTAGAAEKAGVKVRTFPLAGPAEQIQQTLEMGAAAAERRKGAVA